MTLSRLGREEEAEASYREALAIDPNYEEAHYNLGARLGENNPTEAEKHFRRALELDPDYGIAYRELGRLLRKQEQFDESEAHVRRAIELEPDDAWAHIYLGELLNRKGDVSQAEDEFHWAPEAELEWAMPVWAQASLYEDRKEWAEATKLYKRALELGPDDKVANMLLGRMLIKRNRRADAKVFLVRALLLDPAYQEAKLLLDSLASKDPDPSALETDDEKDV